VDVHVAASNRDVNEALEQASCARTSIPSEGFQLHLPPLRDRPEDIRALRH
jgi:transcriptional regulator with AAA-type ATPase domain